MQEGIYKYSTSSILGYYRDYTGRVKIEPAEAEIVRYIYDSFIEGATYSSIAESLTYQEYLSPTGKKKWSGGTIKSILTNEKYCGDVLFQKTFVKNFKSHVTVKNNSILTKWYVQNDHEAIISREKWTMVQELVKNYNPSRKHVGARSYTLMPNFFRIKTGVLRGFYLIDMSWNKSLKNSFINLIKNNK